MSQLSPSHPSHRKYSAKRPVGHQPFRPPCLSEIFDSYFCCLLISPQHPPSLFTAYFTSFVWELAPVPETAFYCTSPFPSSAEKTGGEEGEEVCKDETACAPPAPSDTPPYFLFSHGPITRGLEGYHTPYFTWRRYLQPLKIYFYERERERQRKREARSLSSTVHWDSGEENHQQKPSSSEHTNLQSPSHCSGKRIHFLNGGKRE